MTPTPPAASPEPGPPSDKKADATLEVLPPGEGIVGVPVRTVGATGVLDCEIWSTDLRERLEHGDPLRAGFVASPADGTAAAVERLGKLHDVALMVTRIDR